MCEHRGGHVLFEDVAVTAAVVEGGDEDLCRVADIHFGDFVLWHADFHRQALGADDAHDGLQRSDTLALHSAQVGDGAIEGCGDGIVGQHGIGQVESGLCLFEVGHHLTPFNLGQTAVFVHFLQAVVGVLGLFEGGLRRALSALHLRRRHTRQHLSLTHRATFLHVKRLQGAAVFEADIDGVTFLKIARIAVAHQASYGVDALHPYGNDTLLSRATDELLLELARVGIDAACQQQRQKPKDMFCFHFSFLFDSGLRDTGLSRVSCLASRSLVSINSLSLPCGYHRHRP